MEGVRGPSDGHAQWEQLTVVAVGIEHARTRVWCVLVFDATSAALDTLVMICKLG